MSVSKLSGDEVNDAITLALIEGRTVLLTPTEFGNAVGFTDPRGLMPRFWKYLKIGQMMIVDNLAFKCIGFYGDVKHQTKTLRNMLHRCNIPYRMIGVDEATDWSETIEEAEKCDPRTQWIVMSGYNFRMACLFAQNETSQLTSQFFLELELLYRIYDQYCERFRNNVTKVVSTENEILKRLLKNRRTKDLVTVTKRYVLPCSIPLKEELYTNQQYNA